MSISVSVIMPVYNGEKYLERSLMSLANQTLEDIEIICVNNASTDSSLNILLAFKEVFPDKFVIVNSETNGGPGGGRNIGIHYASGEYIGFLDQDDYVDKDMYRLMYEEGKKDNFDIVSSGYYYNKNPKMPIKIKGSIDIDKKIMLCNDVLYIWNKIYKTTLVSQMSELFRKNTYDDDVDFCIEAILRSDKITFVDKLFYYYDQNADSKTATLYNNKINLKQLMAERKNLFSALKRRIESTGLDKYIFEICNDVYPYRIVMLLFFTFSLDNFNYDIFCKFDDVARSFSRYYYKQRYIGDGIAHAIWNEISEDKEESYNRLVALKKQILTGDFDKEKTNIKKAGEDDVRKHCCIGNSSGI